MGNEWKKRLVVAKEKAQQLGLGAWHSRGYLPHFSGDAVTQLVTYRLVDSMPQEVLARWSEELKHLPPTEFDLEKRKRIDAYLDQGYGNCYLKDERIAALVQENLLFADNGRYRLYAWCIMPNHVHVLFTPSTSQELGKIVHSWKSYTAHECNKLLNRTGEFWQKEMYDRYIRDEKHFATAIRYIENNPVKAGLCASPEDWLWSSAGSARDPRAEVSGANPL